MLGAKGSAQWTMGKEKAGELLPPLPSYNNNNIIIIYINKHNVNNNKKLIVSSKLWRILLASVHVFLLKFFLVNVVI